MGLYSDRIVEKPKVSSQVTVRGRTVRASEHDDRRRGRDSPERRPRGRNSESHDLRNRLGNRLEARKQQPSRHVLDRLGGRPGDSGRPGRGRGGRGGRGGFDDDRGGDRGDREEFGYFQHDDRTGTAKAVLQATLEGEYTGEAVDRHKDAKGRSQVNDKRGVRGRGATMERTNNRRGGRGGRGSWQHDMYDEDDQSRTVHDRLGGMDMDD